MLTVQVQAFSASARIAPADVQALAGALVPVAARLGVAPPPLEGALRGMSLAYAVEGDAHDEDTAFREQCRQLGLVFALSRVRPDWSWSVRASPPLLADAAGAPEVIWVRDGAVVLRHADAPRGERVLPSAPLSAAVISELVHGLGGDALRWLGVPTDGAGPSRRAALESSRGVADTDTDAGPLTLDGPVAGAGDMAPLEVQSLSVSVPPPGGGTVRDWTAAARVRLGGGEPIDAVDVVVRLRSGDGRLLAVGEASLEAVGAGEVVRIEVEGRGEGPLETAVAADAWFALRRSHRLSGTVVVTAEEG